MRRWLRRWGGEPEDLPIPRHAEVHRFRRRLFVTAGWFRGFGVAVPEPAGAVEIGRLVAEALDWSGRNPRPLITVLGKPDPVRQRDEQGWERFCRTGAGVEVTRYHPEIGIQARDHRDGRLRLCPVAGGHRVASSEVTVPAGAGTATVGGVIERLLAQTAPEWPSFRRATVSATNDGRLAVYGQAGVVVTPVQILDADAGRTTVGAAIEAALSASEHLADAGLPWRQALVAAGLDQRELRQATVSISQTTTGAIHLAFGQPGDDRAQEEEQTIEEADPTAVAATVMAWLGRAPASPASPGVPFGYKTAWLAVRAGDPEAVCDAVGLTARRRVSWPDGVEESYRGGVFVTPPVAGWVLAVGIDLARQQPDLLALSASLATEVQFFATHRTSDAHEWHLADRGRLIRAVRYAADAGVYRQVGEPTEAERRLGLGTLTDDPAIELISEDTVMRVAGAWSVDPRRLSTIPTAGDTGVYGRCAR